MKRLLAILVIFLLLFSGCAQNDDIADPALSLRTKLLSSNGCSFDVTITADYEDSLQSFTLHCFFDKQGSMSFSVLQPESISGISGKVAANGGQITFDDQVLMFSLLADGQITPVSAPWVFMKSLRGGYIKSYTDSDSQRRISIDDSYQEDPLHLDIWMNTDKIPIRCEILWRGRRILSLDVKNFIFM